MPARECDGAGNEHEDRLVRRAMLVIAVKRSARFLARSASVFCFLTVTVLFASYYSMLRLRQPEWEHARFETLVRGSAPAPFQYRVLFPWIFRAIRDVGIFSLSNDSAREFCFWVEFVSVFLLVVCFRRYLSLFLPDNLTRILALSMALVLPFHYLIPKYMRWYYVYDTPSVLFFLIGMMLLYQRRWFVFYPLFAIAALNRETIGFLAVVYLATTLGQERLARVWPHVVAQALLWTAVKTALYRVYNDNPGGLYWNVLTWNLNACTNDYYLVLMASALGYTWIPVVFFWRKIKNRFVRRAVLVAPVFIVVMLVVGKAPEMRIYGELIPVMLPAFLLVLDDLWSRTSETCH